MLAVPCSRKWIKNQILSVKSELKGRADELVLGAGLRVSMEIQMLSNCIDPIIKRAGRFIAVCVLILSASMAIAQNEYWPIATLQPPGLGAQITPIAGVALAGDVAVTVYKQTQTIGYRVFLRKRNAQGWDSPQLLVQGQPGEGEGVTVSADADHIAIGLRKADMNGRVDVYVRNGTDWILQQSIPAAPPVYLPVADFGYAISLRQSLLVVSSANFPFLSQFDTYRYDTMASSWVLAGYSIASITGTATAKTDGQRVASCLNNRCGSRLHEGNGVFSAEGEFPAPSAPTFAIDGEWIFTASSGQELRAYQRSGTTWTLRQQFGQAASFAVSGGRLIVGLTASSVQFYQLDGSGVWQLTESLADPAAGSKTINQTYALSGIQSFTTAGGPWSTSGVVEGVSDVASFRFGAAVSLAANRVWIGSPGYNDDYGSGAVWMDALDGNSQTTPRNLAATFLAPNLAFGQVVATDGIRVAVASLPSFGAALPIQVRVYPATSTSTILANISTPPTATRAGVVDVAIEGNTLALLRAVGGVDEVLVYENIAASYVLQQTITLPPSAFKKVVLLGDLLLVGQSQFQRFGGATGAFAQIGDVVNPPGVALNFGRMARYGTLLAVAANFPTAGEPIARVFKHTVGGWVYSGDINRGAFPDAQCTLPAAGTFPTAGANVVACVVGTTLSIATPNLVGSGWTITRSATVPGLTTGPVSINAVAIEGDHVALGVPGQSKVVVVDITESIFAAGFDQ